MAWPRLSDHFVGFYRQKKRGGIYRNFRRWSRALIVVRLFFAKRGEAFSSRAAVSKAASADNVARRCFNRDRAFLSAKYSAVF